MWMKDPFSPGRGTRAIRGSLAATLAPAERASLNARALRLHVRASLDEPQFGSGVGVGGVRGQLVNSLRLECFFLELRHAALVVASSGGGD